MPAPHTLGGRIAQARREKGVRDHRDVTQADVGKAVGVSGAAVSQWESGDRVPREDVLAKLADYLDVTPSYLRYGIKPETINVGGLEIDRASLVRFSDAELAEARRKIAEEEAREQERAARESAQTPGAKKRRRSS